MTRGAPVAPDALDVALPVALGRLAPALHRLALTQGAWPPAVPAHAVLAPEAGNWPEGMAAGDRLVDEGADLVIARGEGDRGTALALLAVLLSLEPVAAVGTAGTPGWSGLVTAVRDGLHAGKQHLTDPDAMVVAVGALHVAGLAGVMLQAATRRTPVLLSATPHAVAAAVLAERVGPGTKAWLIAGCSAPTGACETGLTHLGLTPLLDLRLPGPEGADLALQLLPGAVELTRG